jgi:6-phosphogluconolactonase (cycloisomerase 2 family)
MKGNTMRQLGGSRILKTVGASLAVGLGMTACSRDYTVDYLYVTAAGKTTQGSVYAYAVDYQSGALTPLADSPIPSGGNNPVALVATPSQKYVYVINEAAPSSNVQPFEIGTDGKLYPGQAVPVVQNAGATIVGSLPTAIAIDPTGSFLYITFEYQNGYSATSPGPGGVAVYPIDPSTGALGSPVMNGTLPYFPTGDNPVGIVVDPKNDAYVYVIDQEKPANASPFGVLLTFARDKTTGALTQVVPTGSNTVAGGLKAGTQPAAIAEDPGSNFLYVTDSITDQLYGYLASAGVATPTGTPPLVMNSSPFTTGSFPEGVTVDPRGEYVYVANFNSETVSGFAINVATGALSSVAGSSANAVATGPTCVAIDPALGIYLYTSNNVDGSVNGLQLNPHTGALTNVQGSKFPSGTLPTCAVAVGNGAHATQIVE